MSHLLQIGGSFSWEKIHQHNLNMVKQLEDELLNTSLSPEEKLSIKERLDYFKWLV